MKARDNDNYHHGQHEKSMRFIPEKLRRGIARMTIEPTMRKSRRRFMPVKARA